MAAPSHKPDRGTSASDGRRYLSEAETAARPVPESASDGRRYLALSDTDASPVRTEGRGSDVLSEAQGSSSPPEETEEARAERLAMEARARTGDTQVIAALPDPAEGMSAAPRPGNKGGAVFDPGLGRRDGLGRAGLVGLGKSGRYKLGNIVARGAESVLYEAHSGGAVFCVKAIRNMFGRLFTRSGPENHESKIQVPYSSKVRHLKNEFTVSQSFTEIDDSPVVRMYALRRVRKLGVEVGYDLLMDLIAGGDLSNRQILARMTPEQKVDALYQSARALAYIHSKGLVHLDMKPSNLMYTDGKITLIDFGMTVGQGHKATSVAGTAGYLSPEQLARDYIDERADIFALGLTFGVIFGGKPLRQSPKELKSRQLRLEAKFHLENVEEPMVSTVPELKDMPRLLQLLQLCTIPKREKRIQSIATITNSLQRIAADRGIPLTGVDGS